MRVLIVQPGSFGGAERQTLMMARLLAAHGVEAHLLVGPELGGSSWLSARVARRVTRSAHLPSGNWREGDAADETRLLLWRYLYRGMRVRQAIARLLRGDRFDVVYASQPFAWGTATPVARRFGASVVWRVGGPVVAGGRFGRAVLRTWSARHPPDAVVTCSGEVAAVFAPLLGRPVTVIPNGVDTSHFKRAAPRRPPRHGSVTIGFAGRMVESKGVRDLLRAAAATAAAVPGARFVLAGSGPRLAAFRREAVALGLRDRIRFSGFERDMRRFYTACDVFVLPSYAEGHANVLLEAMAMGVAVVATDLPGTREMIDDGVQGVLVPVADAPALARAIIRLCLDPRERERLAAQAAARVRERLEARDAGARLAALFHVVRAAADRQPSGRADRRRSVLRNARAW